MLAFVVRRLALLSVAALVLLYAIWLCTTKDGISTIHHLNLDALLPRSFQQWLLRMLHGNLGYSIRQHIPVSSAMGNGILVTLLLIVPAFLLQELLALALGALSAVYQRSWVQRGLSFFALIGVSLPIFWLALLVIEFLAVQWPILPATGIVDLRTTGAPFATPAYWDYFYGHVGAELGDIARHLIAPVGILVFTGIASDSQYVRLALLDVLNQEYIRAARARGLRERRIIGKHALRNALLPIITNIGIQLPRLVFAAALIELIFSLPGLGHLFASAIYTPPSCDPRLVVCLRQPKDYDVITAFFIVLGGIALLSSFVTDLIYALIDPRVRLEGGITSRAAPSSPLGDAFVVGPWRVQRRQITIALSLILVGLLGVVAVRQFSTPTLTIGGEWYGQIRVNGYTNAVYGYMTLTVSDDGTASGQAQDCSGNPAPVSASYALNGTVSGNGRIELNWLPAIRQAQNRYSALTGKVPLHHRPLDLHGIYADLYGIPHAVSMHLQQGPIADFRATCAASQLKGS